ncbi:hypothetical protein BO70DRAFT_395889 [Aspergillus heteromorphus CBS 117.55]|uniref:Uncharacterized protein n=1 Tax=Aspergillus heteromorphus CBS 117.55 TaxID=1448321 RepID=A0A317WDS0_9EURO|nr:uncharacterized protein BO70DRAFT_395889 [Aspergillus heteromorphus CBS 117.55]PWY83447.1 hypothetical protein BO70DRAFT_395889 [Aspergillus heteromorphus CBS 117.55]
MDPTTVTTNPDIHKPLITALATFYTLLVDLRYIPPAWLIQPSPETGRHPTNLINAAAAARRNGFGPSAIDLAYQIPYIVDEDVKLNPDTQPLCYLTRLGGAVQPLSNSEQRDADLADEWEYARDPTFQGRDDTWAGSNVLVLTRGQVYGVVLVYDIDER